MNKRYPIFLVTLFTLAGCSGTPPQLGVVNGKLTECPDKPNCVCSFAQSEEHAIEPISFSGDTTAAREAILARLALQKNARVTEEKEDYIRAEFTSRLFRFVDDVEFYFPETDTNITLIHMRSASRIGRSDFGVNRKRLEMFRSMQ